MTRFRFYVILFVIGFGCLCILSGEFLLGVAMFLVACYLVAIL